MDNNMNKNLNALNPPMGWNSWECYGASVTEEELLRNADYMEKHLKPFGWEYVVCDIQWYEPGADSTRYHNFADLCMDEFGRLVPAVNRFPSADQGRGFSGIAEYIHNKGLKFGIHILRGIPRQAVYEKKPIKGTNVTAREIAHSFSICSWNTDMYGVDPAAPGAQAYYDTIFELYASWGVDFVKVDDIGVTYGRPDNWYSAKEEIELIYRAIQHCGRPMVLSLSPGPAIVEQAGHLCKYANMWRITNDLWDRWEDILEMFTRCRNWSPYVAEGCFPDCDMLPLGHLSIRGCELGLEERQTRLTHPEQRTMMTLWSIFRSPLMLGCELTDLDEWTYNLITNEEVLSLLKKSRNAREIMNMRDVILWQSEDEEGNTYLAVFNLANWPLEFEISMDKLELAVNVSIRNLWERKDEMCNGSIRTSIEAHGAQLYRLNPKCCA